MAFMNILSREIKRHGDAILIGAGVGIIAAWYAISQGLADLNAIAAAGKGLIDSLMSREGVDAIATTKVYGVFAIVGGAVGYGFSKVLQMFKPKRIIRRSRRRRR